VFLIRWLDQLGLEKTMTGDVTLASAASAFYNVCKPDALKGSYYQEKHSA